jgi:hypothetical protein
MHMNYYRHNFKLGCISTPKTDQTYSAHFRVKVFFLFVCFCLFVYTKEKKERERENVKERKKGREIKRCVFGFGAKVLSNQPTTATTNDDEPRRRPRRTTANGR